MKILVVYYSRTSVTKTVARTISKTVGADLEEIHDLLEKKGIAGYIGAGYGALLDRLTRISEPKSRLEEYDLVVVGTPVWAGKPSVPVTTFLKKYGNKIRNLAVFVTHGTENRYQKAIDFIEYTVHKKPVRSLSVTSNMVKKMDFEKIIRFATELSNLKIAEPPKQ